MMRLITTVTALQSIGYTYWSYRHWHKLEASRRIEGLLAAINYGMSVSHAFNRGPIERICFGSALFLSITISKMIGIERKFSKFPHYLNLLRSRILISVYLLAISIFHPKTLPKALLITLDHIIVTIKTQKTVVLILAIRRERTLPRKRPRCNRNVVGKQNRTL